MSNVLVIFESKYGQAAKIAEHVAKIARTRGHDPRVVSVDLAPQLDAIVQDDNQQIIIIVAPVYFGHHPRAIRAFVRRHADWISAHPCAFLSVCNAAADERVAAQSQAYRYAADFMTATKLRPSVYMSVAGAIAYPRYGFFVRRLMRLIDRSSGRTSSAGTSIRELTDFPAVDYAMTRFFKDAEAGTTINTVRTISSSTPATFRAHAFRSAGSAHV